MRTRGDHLLVDGLVVADATAVRLAREREQAGEDPAPAVADAIEIGARVLDREHVGANVEFVRSEFEKVSRDVEAHFAERAGDVGKELAGQLEQAFGPDSGHVTKALERHFGDESTSAVQHRVRAVVDEAMVQAREQLLRQFTAADGRNPLSDFKAASVAAIRQAGDRQDAALRSLVEKLSGLERELQGLRAEREKQLELAVEHERGTAKGREFEQVVHESLDAIARGQGDDCDLVGDLKGVTRKTGDIVVAIDGACGPARGRIVFEAKTARLSKTAALRELDRGLHERDADYAVLVVSGEDKLPARAHGLREYNGDKLMVAQDPEDRTGLALELAYRLARARVLMLRGDDAELDLAALGDTIERALQAMADVRRIKSQLSGATTSIQQARDILEEMADRVRGHLEDLDRQVALADAD